MKPGASLKLPFSVRDNRGKVPQGRKPRTRERGWATDKKKKKERFLSALATGKTDKEAIEQAMTTQGAIESYKRTDPGFLAEVQKAKAEGEVSRARAAGVLDHGLEDIAKRVKHVILTSKDERVVLSGGIPVLKGRGVLQGDIVNVGVQVNLPPKYIEVREVQARGENGN